MSSSEIEEHLLRVFDTLFYLPQEQNGLPAVDDPVVVRESHVHDWSCKNLATHYDWPHFRRVHTQNGALWHINDWCAHHAAENTTVSNRESTTYHVLNCDLAIASALGEVSK